MTIDPRRLLVFKAVADAGSFSGAAARLHLSQPAVSRAVASLEAAAGVTLLRRRDGLALTPAGELLLQRARVIAGHLDRAGEDLAAIRALEAGRVNVGAFPTALRSFVVAALQGIHRAHPKLRVHVTEIGGGEAVAAVGAGLLDVALGFEAHGRTPPAGADVAIEPLASEPLYAAVPAGHRLARRRRIRLEELAADPWIQHGGATSPRLVERSCRRAGFEPRIAAEADATQSLVAAGLGVTLVPALALPTARRDVRILALADPPLRDIYAARLADFRAPATDAMLEALRAACVSIDPLCA